MFNGKVFECGARLLLGKSFLCKKRFIEYFYVILQAEVFCRFK